MVIKIPHNHKWVYGSRINNSDGPFYPKICTECGEKATDQVDLLCMYDSCITTDPDLYDQIALKYSKKNLK